LEIGRKYFMIWRLAISSIAKNSLIDALCCTVIYSEHGLVFGPGINMKRIHFMSKTLLIVRVESLKVRVTCQNMTVAGVTRFLLFCHFDRRNFPLTSC